MAICVSDDMLLCVCAGVAVKMSCFWHVIDCVFVVLVIATAQSRLNARFCLSLDDRMSSFPLLIWFVGFNTIVDLSRCIVSLIHFDLM